jgi:hypothetical protein
VDGDGRLGRALRTHRARLPDGAAGCEPERRRLLRAGGRLDVRGERARTSGADRSKCPADRSGGRSPGPSDRWVRSDDRFLGSLIDPSSLRVDPPYRWIGRSSPWIGRPYPRVDHRSPGSVGGTCGSITPPLGSVGGTCGSITPPRGSVGGTRWTITSSPGSVPRTRGSIACPRRSVAGTPRSVAPPHGSIARTGGSITSPRGSVARTR